MSAYERKTWQDLLDSGLLWWINRSLHLFGWAIVVEVQPDGTVGEVYPAHTRFRGFSTEDEDEGFRKVTAHVRDRADRLVADCNE